MNENIVKIILEHIENNKCIDCIYQEDISLKDNELNISINESPLFIEDEYNLLYALKFDNASYDPLKNTLICQGINDDNCIMEFEDRPGREYGFITKEDLIDLWDPDMENSFSAVNPNATLYVNNKLYKIVLNKANCSDNTIEFIFS
jgi:hypothetical protein